MVSLITRIGSFLQSGPYHKSKDSKVDEDAIHSIEPFAAACDIGVKAPIRSYVPLPVHTISVSCLD